MAFLPTTVKEARQRGWDSVDVVLFTGDAYIDHPAFGAAVIGRLLEAEGYRVAVVPQPNWRDDLRDFRKFGIYAAIDIVEHRRAWTEWSRNPLQRAEREKGGRDISVPPRARDTSPTWRSFRCWSPSPRPRSSGSRSSEQPSFGPNDV